MHINRPRSFSWRSLVAVLALASSPIHADTSWIWADGPDSKSVATVATLAIAGMLTLQSLLHTLLA